MLETASGPSHTSLDTRVITGWDGVGEGTQIGSRDCFEFHGLKLEVPRITISWALAYRRDRRKAIGSVRDQWGCVWGGGSSAAVAMKSDRPQSSGRYRLRFLLQEYDLPMGSTLIGRGDDCHITIFDPSISRRHARIVTDNNSALFEDLGSRNGCRINGSYVREPTELSDGDRIRIGTQELVFSEVHTNSHVHYRQTGSICYCASCHAAYAKEMDWCPHCGSTLRGASPSGTESDEEMAQPSPRRRASGPPVR